MLGKAKYYLATRKIVDIALLVLIALLATRGWLNLEIPRGHDVLGDMLLAQAASHTISLQSLLSGWSNEWYLGFPLFYVHPPLVSYLVWALSYPFGWILGTKLLYLSFYILSGVFAYLYVLQLTRNRPASFAAGLAYVFLPYHVLEVAFEGHHGAFGLPYLLTPLILLCLERLIQKPGPKYTLITAILLASMTLTYPQVLPFLIGPFLVLYLGVRICCERRRGPQYLKNVARSSVAAFCLALLLTSFWWLPLLSEIRYSAAASFPLAAAREFSASFFQAITLRPDFCCAPTSAYGSSGQIHIEMLRVLPFVLVLLGVVLNFRNRYVWFFSGSILIAMLLAMGPDSPVPLFNLAHRYVPFFSGLRTPWRFLLFSSLAYAVLIGFCVKGISEWLRRLHLAGFRSASVSFVVLALTSLLVVGNTWQETRTAFSTLTLTDDQRSAFVWLEAQDEGDHRITDLPFKTWVRDAEDRWVINPVYWTYLHGKYNVYGGVPAVAVKYSATALESLNADLERAPFDMSQWLSTLNVKYVLLDKTDSLFSNVILDEDFERVCSSDTVDIYENHAMKPRLFSFSATDERNVQLWTADQIRVQPAEGDDVALALDTAHIPSLHTTLKASFQFRESHGEWLNLAVDVSTVHFSADDSIRLRFYSDIDLPDIYTSLDVVEQDGSRYGRDLNRVDGIKAGWNEIDFPISLLTLRYSTDENARLDPDQIQALWFGPGEVSHPGKPHRFQLYFTAPSVVSYDMDGAVQYTRMRSGKYEVHVSLDSSSLLVLSEAYHPNWAARFNGQTTDSVITYECLNGFRLPPGEYDIILEFTKSPLRTAGTVISIISVLSLLLASAFLLGTKAWRRRLSH